MNKKKFFINSIWIIRIFVVFGFLFITLFPSYYNFFNWHIPEVYPFLDLKGRLAHIEAHRLGLDTYLINNPLDPLRRINDKPSISLLLGHINIGQNDFLWIGSFLSLSTVIISLSLITNSNIIYLIGQALCIFNPNTLFAIERANDDLLIFIMTFIIPYIITKKSQFFNYLYLSLVFILGAIKYYPLSLFSLIFSIDLIENFKFYKKRIPITIAIWLLLFGKEFFSLREKLPLNITNINAFKLLDFFIFFKDKNAYDIDLLSGSFLHLILIVGFICTIIGLNCFMRKSALHNNEFLLIHTNSREKLLFLCGASLLLFCYTLGGNSGYRMIHSIFFLPLLIKIINANSVLKRSNLHAKFYIFCFLLLLSSNWISISIDINYLFFPDLFLKIKIISDLLLFLCIGIISLDLLDIEKFNKVLRQNPQSG